MKKKWLALLVIGVSIFSTACAGNSNDASDSAASTASVSSTDASSESLEEPSQSSEAQETTTISQKPRTVITTDGEVDDMNSVIRALLYANEMDIAGIVLTSSTYHYAGDPEAGIEAFRWTGTEWLDNFLNAYEEVYPNLTIHAQGYPTPDYLKSVTHIGNITKYYFRSR